MKKPFLLLTLIAAIALLLPQDAWPQKPEAMRRIGVLGVGKPPSPDAPKLPPVEFFRLFLETLAKRGYVEGKNLVIEARRGEYEQAKHDCIPGLDRNSSRPNGKDHERYAAGRSFRRADDLGAARLVSAPGACYG